MAEHRVSMADVAARAGVSGQTVSRVVNGSPRVDPATRARVGEAMSALGYRPHAAARTLRTGRSRTIGVIVSTLATVGNSRMLESVARAASERDLALTVVTLGSGGRDRIGEAFARLRDQGVDGAVVVNEASAFARDVASSAGLRLAVVDAPVDERFDVVESDHAGGAFAATRLLLELGHKTVWHLAGPETSYAAAARENGWRRALEAAGAITPPVMRGDWTSASGFTAGEFLAADAGVSAVFAANDQMALGVLRAIGESGRSVPEDVSVVGFDDVPDAAQYLPPLTTVRQEFDALGELAVAALAEGLANDSPSARRTVPTSLVVRGSTAPPPRPMVTRDSGRS